MIDTARCTKCKTKFEYGDHMSPMFNEAIWKEIIEKAGLSEYEKIAKEKYNKWNGNPSTDRYCYHTYICYECAEKLLGRKIRLSDLNNSWFNVPFLMFYFDMTEEEANVYTEQNNPNYDGRRHSL